MQLSQFTITKLKESVTDLQAFSDRLKEERDTIKYYKEFLVLSSAIGRIESVIEISEK